VGQARSATGRQRYRQATGQEAAVKARGTDGHGSATGRQRYRQAIMGQKAAIKARVTDRQWERQVARQAGSGTGRQRDRRQR
jgi:hypothetical protein